MGDNITTEAEQHQQEEQAKHLLELPSELLTEIMSRLDYKSRKEFGETCKYLSGLVSDFEKNRAYLPPDSEEEDGWQLLEGDEDDDHDDRDFDLDDFVNDELERRSFGSNYDSDYDLDDY